ncbi:MAG: hypothetical protein ABIZ81_11900 [Opitutaceae bacterium]
MDEFDETPPVSRPKPSKIPSWIMLGFILGAVFVWALPRPRPERSVTPPVTPVIPAFAVETPPRLTDVETFFDVWRRFALWDGDTTYVCLWDSGTRTFRDCFQIIQRGDELFFRSVPRPRNLRPRSDVPKDSPFEFLNPIPELRGLFGAPISPPPETPSSDK